jgi:hypothetical protein
LYDSEQDTVSIGLNWFSGNKHEIRLKSQFVALQADNPQSLISDSGGYLYDSDDLIKPFTQGVVSFQVRYKYEIAPLSYLYLVYSKGGTSYDEDEIILNLKFLINHGTILQTKYIQSSLD